MCHVCHVRCCLLAQQQPMHEMRLTCIAQHRPIRRPAAPLARHLCLAVAARTFQHHAAFAAASEAVAAGPRCSHSINRQLPQCRARLLLQLRQSCRGVLLARQLCCWALVEWLLLLLLLLLQFLLLLLLQMHQKALLVVQELHLLLLTWVCVSK